MPDPKEFNRAVKQGVDVFMSGDSPETFMQPIQSGEDLISRGLLDGNGRATSKGVLFTQLQDAGLFDQGGKLTEKGHAYSMPLESALSRENLWAFQVRENDGVDKPETTFDQMAGGVGEFVWDAAAALAKNIGYEAVTTFKNDPELETKLGLSNIAITEGSIKATTELAQMAGVGAAWIGTGLGKLIGMDEEAQNSLWMARQDQARQRNDHANIAVGKTLEDLGMASSAVEFATNAKNTLSPEDYAATVKQGTAFGQFLDPTVLLPAGAAAKAGKLSVTTRLAIKADQVLAKTAALDSRLTMGAIEMANAQRGMITAKNAGELATKMGDDLAARFEQTGDVIASQRAEQARAIAARSSALAAAHTDDAARLAGEMENLAAARQSLATRIPENIAAATQQALEVGRQAKQIPFAVLGGASEKIGGGLVALDKKLSAVAEQFGGKAAQNILKMGIGAAGYTAAGIPGVAMAGGVMAAGPMLESIGKFARVVGKEMTKARGQVPFWQKVANYSELSSVHRGLAHLADTATMGGAVSGAVRRTARGVTAAYPINLMFEMLADGGDPNADTFKRAAAEALVIGGSSAMLGGMFQGTKARHRELAVGDEVNFRADMTDQGQRVLFDGMKPATRRSIATYAASSPQLKFRFTESGQSSLSGQTATINIRSTNPIKPLIAHEVMHHVLIRNQNEAGVTALLIGDGEAGGLLRSNDGTLDPNFQQFHDAYNARMRDAGLEPIGTKQAALEYYVDSAADHVAEIAESGELGSIAGRTEARRMISRVVAGTMSKIPIIRDIHFKMGGLQDSEGRMVMGNGLLSEGIRELPQVRAMTREMLKTSAGRSQGTFEAVGASRKDDAGGVTIPVQKGDRPVIDKLISIFETEEINGQTRVKYDAAGDPIPISSATDAARSKIGLVIGEALQALKAQGKVFKENELFMAEDGTWKGTFLGDGVLRAIESRGILNKEQIRILKNLNGASRDFNGSRFVVINHPATKKVGKKVRYATLAPTLRDVVPVALIPTKDGNLTVGLMSVTQLNANIETRVASKRGKALYNGNRELVMNDVSAVMDLHRADKRTDAYFDEKYGATKGKEYKNFVNTLFGLMSPAMKDVNPLFEADKVGYKDNVYKTYRIDRISQATRMSGDTHIPMPFVYDSAKLNLMPNGLPTLDANGAPVARFMPEKSGVSGENGPESPHANLRRDTPSGGQDGGGMPSPVYPRPEAGPGSIAQFLSPDRKPPRYNYAFQSAEEIGRQTTALKRWAQATGIFLSPEGERRLLRGSRSKSGGSEHEVYRFGLTDGDYVIKKTHEVGGFIGAAPAQYLDRWSDFEKLFPEIVPEVIGVSDGHIFIKQKFIQGEVYSDPKILEADMNANGWDKVGPAKFKHRETSAIISDARPDNVIKGLDGKLWPFDVMVDDVGTN